MGEKQNKSKSTGQMSSDVQKVKWNPFAKKDSTDPIPLHVEEKKTLKDKVKIWGQNRKKNIEWAGGKIGGAAKVTWNFSKDHVVTPVGNAMKAKLNGHLKKIQSGNFNVTDLRALVTDVGTLTATGGVSAIIGPVLLNELATNPLIPEKARKNLTSGKVQLVIKAAQGDYIGAGKDLAFMSITDNFGNVEQFPVNKEAYVEIAKKLALSTISEGKVSDKLTAAREHAQKQYRLNQMKLMEQAAIKTGVKKYIKARIKAVESEMKKKHPTWGGWSEGFQSNWTLLLTDLYMSPTTVNAKAFKGTAADLGKLLELLRMFGKKPLILDEKTSIEELKMIQQVWINFLTNNGLMPVSTRRVPATSSNLSVGQSSIQSVDLGQSSIQSTEDHESFVSISLGGEEIVTPIEGAAGYEGEADFMLILFDKSDGRFVGQFPFKENVGYECTYGAPCDDCGFMKKISNLKVRYGCTGTLEVLFDVEGLSNRRGYTWVDLDINPEEIPSEFYAKLKLLPRHPNPHQFIT